MRIKTRITIYFSLATIGITGIAFVFVYILFSHNREEEFQMRQKEKISTTLKLLAQVRETDHELIEALDRLTINDLYDEKLLLFNDKKELIYSSVDDTPVPFSNHILARLTPENKWVETKDGLYDVVGTFIESNGNTFFGISKAYDNFGYSKLSFLKYVLLLTFLSISAIIVLISLYLSKKITQQLSAVTGQIQGYNFEDGYQPIDVEEEPKNEVAVLAEQFNKLMKRMSEVFSFQKHAIHHISHELKTPIAVLVSNFEKIEGKTDIEAIKAFIKTQKEDTRNLSEIIDSLLEIAKAETSDILKGDRVRIDEVIFDIADELKNIYPACRFSIEYAITGGEDNLIIAADARLIKSALLNLMQNSVQYSKDGKAKITISNNNGMIQLAFVNNGAVITEDERQYLFQHFFRGINSKNKRGFGLGLVLVHRIITLHGGSIAYFPEGDTLNTFTVHLPLS